MSILIDLILVGIIVFNALKGMKKGFVSMAVRTLSIIMAIIASVLLCDNLAKLFDMNEIIAKILAFIIIFVLSLLLFRLSDRLTRKFDNNKIVKKTNEILGLIFGILLGIFYAWVLSLLLGVILDLFAENVVYNSFLLESLYSFSPLELFNIF